MLFEEVCEVLDNNGIEYVINEAPDGTRFIYINHGDFGRPKGLKINKKEFRPEFRISVHAPGMIYTKICGYTSYMRMEDILDTILN